MKRSPVFAASLILTSAALLWASGIIPAILPAAVPTANKIGNSTKFQLGAVGATAGNCAIYDASLNLTGTSCSSGPTGPTGATGPTGPTGAAGGGSFALVEAHTAAASASLTFTTCLTSTYDDYQIEIVSLIPATDGAAINLHLSSDGGSSYITSGYTWVSNFLKVDTSAGALTSTTSIQLSNAVANTGGASISGTIKMFDPLNAGILKLFVTDMFEIGSAGAFRFYGGGSYNTTVAINAFRVIASSGNLTSGAVRCYGLAH